jgi:beta-glucosidase
MKRSVLSLVVLAGIMGFCYAQETRPKASAPASSQVGNTATQPASRAAQRHRAILHDSQANKFDVIFLGDSITEGFDKALWQEHLLPLKAGNFGVSGDRTEHVLWRITEGGELEGQNPRLFVMMIGVNNLWGRRNNAQQVSEGIELIVKTLGQKFPQAKVLLLGTLPTAESPNEPIRQAIKEINTNIAKLADGKSIRFVDFGERMLQADGTISKEIMPDFLHPNAKGYETFLANVKPLIVEMLQSQ